MEKAARVLLGLFGVAFVVSVVHYTDNFADIILGLLIFGFAIWAARKLPRSTVKDEATQRAS